MFERAKAFVLENFKTSDNNIQFNEKDLQIVNAGVIILEGTKSNHPPQSYCNFKINIEFKEGRYKVKFDNIIVQPKYGYEARAYENIRKNNSFDKHLRKKVNEALPECSSKLERAIRNKPEQNDW